MARKRTSRSRRGRRGSGSFVERTRRDYTHFVATAPRTFTAQEFGTNFEKPGRISAITVKYVSSVSPTDVAAKGFTLGIYNADGKLIRTSPALLPGTTPRSYTMKSPPGTDFGLFIANSKILTIFQGVSLDVVIIVHMAYQPIPVQVIS